MKKNIVIVMVSILFGVLLGYIPFLINNYKRSEQIKTEASVNHIVVCWLKKKLDFKYYFSSFNYFSF